MISVFKKCLSSVCWAQTAIKENKRIYLNPYPIRFHRRIGYFLHKKAPYTLRRKEQWLGVWGVKRS